MSTPTSIRLVIESRVENVPLVGLAVNRITSHLDLGDVDPDQVELAIVEALTNVIRHAYRGLPGREVSLTITICEDHLEFQLCDTGASIPPERLASRPRLRYDPTDVSSLPEGGMGLFLMHQIMDEVRYERVENRNTLTLVKTFSHHLEPS